MNDAKVRTGGCRSGWIRFTVKGEGVFPHTGAAGTAKNSAAGR